MTATAKHRPGKKIRMTGDQIAVSVFGYLLIGLFALICLLPFYLIFIASFTPENDMIRNGYPILPGTVSVEAYALCLKNPLAILRAYGVTAGITVAGTFLAVWLATMTGYVLSRRDFPWRNGFAFFFFSSIAFL